MPEQEQLQYTVRPIPDPTVLTTAQILREVASTREIIETRLNAMDKAIELLRTHTDMFPKRVTDAVEQLQQLHEEKFLSIANQFNLRDVAVAAALKAAQEAVFAQQISNKEANIKMETSFEKRMDQNSALLATMQKSTDEKIEDIKIGRKAGENQIWGYVIAAIGLAIAAASLIFHH
jgi:hypothetical protein